jgi:hypothetical protein
MSGWSDDEAIDFGSGQPRCPFLVVFCAY